MPDGPLGHASSPPAGRATAVAHHAEQYRPGRLTDVFRLPGSNGAPVVLLWHGSGPDEREVLAPLAAGIARLGPLVLVPDWRSDDPVIGPVELVDSIAFARATAGELGGDPGRIVLAGWSLGANAAAACFAYSRIVALFEETWHAVRMFYPTVFYPTPLSLLINRCGYHGVHSPVSPLQAARSGSPPSSKSG